MCMSCSYSGGHQAGYYTTSMKADFHFYCKILSLENVKPRTQLSLKYRRSNINIFQPRTQVTDIPFKKYHIFFLPNVIHEYVYLLNLFFQMLYLSCWNRHIDVIEPLKMYKSKFEAMLFAFDTVQIISPY